MPGHTFKLHGNVYDSSYGIVGIVFRLKLLIDLKSALYRYSDTLGNELCYPVRIGIRKIHYSCYVSDTHPGCKCTEGNNLCDSICTVLSRNVVYDFLSSLVTEIDVEVGHGYTFAVKESLEYEAVSYGIYVSYSYGISNKRAGTRSSSGSNHNAVSLSVVNKVPDYKIVIRIAHASDNIKLISCSLKVDFLFVCSTLYLESLLKTFSGQMLKIFLVIRITLREFVLGKMDGVKVVLRLTHLRDLNRVVHSFLKVREECSHLVFGLHVEVVGKHPHAILIRKLGSRLKAQEYILHIAVFLKKIVAVVSCRQRYTRSVGYSYESGIDYGLLGELITLYLKIVIAAAEELIVP